MLPRSQFDGLSDVRRFIAHLIAMKSLECGSEILKLSFYKYPNSNKPTQG
jgi:hypothetical protein